MKRTLVAATIGAAAAALGPGDVARAQPEPPSAAEKATARELVKTGRKKLGRGDIDGALADLTAADELMGVPSTGVELGKAQARAGMLVEALDTVLAVGRIPRRRYEPAAFVRARAEAEATARDLSDRVPSVRIRLSGTARDGAEVTVDGKPLAPELIGVAYKLNPGAHEVVARNGRAVARAQITVDEGEAREASLVLDLPPPDAAPPASARTWTPHPLVWVGVGLSGAGLLAGTVTGALALDRNATVAPQCPDRVCPPETFDDLREARTLGDTSTAMFVVAGVGAAITVVALFLPYDDESEDEAARGATLAVGLTGAAIRFGF
ncbi:MAG: hypothetical protein AAF928_10500 [Myxococcota bacterium]